MREAIFASLFVKYYIAPAYKEEYINKYCIIADCRKLVFPHNTKEVYMYVGSLYSYIDVYGKILDMLKNNICNVNDENFNGYYIIYCIYLELMSEDVEFFREPNSMLYCYCKTNILVSAIEKFGKFYK